MTAFTKTLTDLTFPIEGSGKAIQFDGSQNYISLGTLGSLGSNLGNGFYCKFNIKTTSSAIGCFGLDNSDTHHTCQIAFNTVAGGIRLRLRDTTAGILMGGALFNTNFNDGNKHEIEISANISAKTISIKIDGVAQTITYNNQNSLTSFANFNINFGLGAQYAATSTINSFFACTVDNFQIGTSPENIYSFLSFDDATSPTSDFTGNSNTGTLTGSPLPSFVSPLVTQTFERDTGKLPTESQLTLTETLTHVRNLILNDSLSLSELISRASVFARSLIDTVTLVEGNGKAIKFDGTQNYISLGNMGSFGSNIGSGFYCSFNIRTTSAAVGNLGGLINVGGGMSLIITMNQDQNGTTASGKITVFLRDTANKNLKGATSSGISFNDGNTHNIVITITPSTNTITISIDGTSKAITYANQQTPASFANFNTPFPIGTGNNQGTVGTFLNAVIDDFKMGTSSSNLYANINFDDGANPTADSSGQSNNGTLNGSPLPSFVDGLSSNGSGLFTKLTSKFLSGSISPIEIGFTGASIQTDGSQNYISLGTLGSLGSNLGSGFYMKFDITMTQTTVGNFGGLINVGGGTSLIIGLNEDQAGSNVAGKIQVFLRDNSNLVLKGANSTAVNFYDGNKHTIIITITPNTNTIGIKIDGVSQAITYNGQQTPATFSNFNTFFPIGVGNNQGTAGTFLAATIDNLSLGTSSSNLYCSLNFDDESNPTADGSGNGNTGSLVGSPVPSFITAAPNVNIATGKAYLETPSFIETFFKTRFELLSEVITLIETFPKNLQKKFLEIINLKNFYFLLESGGHLLLENGGKFTLEPTVATYIESTNISTNKQMGDTIRISDGRINLMPNPSFEEDSIGTQPPQSWGSLTIAHGSPTAQVANDAAEFGSHSWKLSCSAGGGDAAMGAAIPVKPNTTYTVSWYIKTNLTAGDAHLHISFGNGYDWSTFQPGGMQTVSGINNWQRKSLTFTMDSSTSVNVNLCGGSFTGNQFQGDVWYDGILVEESPNLGTYFDGDYQGNWLGSPGNSQSAQPLGNMFTSKLYTETISIGEFFNKIINKTYLATISLLETINKSDSKLLNETLNLLEKIGLFTNKFFSELLSPQEGFTRIVNYARSLSDSISLIEFWQKSHGQYRTFFEQLTISEIKLKLHPWYIKIKKKWFNQTEDL